MLPLLVQYFSILFQNFYLRITRIFRIYVSILVLLGFLGGVLAKNPSPSAGDMGSVPGLGRSSGVGNSNPLQYSCLENSMHRRVWWAKVHGVTKSQTQLRDWTELNWGSSVYRIFQARILEWVVISYSRGSSQPRDQTLLSCICRQIFYHCVTWEAVNSPEPAEII